MAVFKTQNGAIGPSTPCGPGNNESSSSKSRVGRVGADTKQKTTGNGYLLPACVPRDNLTMHPAGNWVLIWAF